MSTQLSLPDANLHASADVRLGAFDASEQQESQIIVERAVERGLTLPASQPLFFILGLLFTAAASLVTLGAGLPPIASYGQDSFIMFDGAWRVLHGQRPHLDFFSAFGPLSYLISAAGLWASKFAAVGIVYSSAAVGLAVGIWTLLLIRTRLEAWSALLCLCFVVLFWLAPFPLGEPFELSGYAMQYNRLGYALLSLILIELYLPAASGSRFSWLYGGLSTGLATGLLLTLKVNYFFVALLLIGPAYAATGKTRKHIPAMLTGFLIVAVALVVYLRWDVSSMARDILNTALARRVRFAQSHDALRTVARNATEMFGLLGLAALAFLFPSSVFARSRRSPATRILLFIAIVLLSDFALSSSNTQRAGMPLVQMAMLIIASQLVRQCLRGAERSRARVALSGAIAVALWVALLPTLMATVNAWGLAMVARSRPQLSAASAMIDAPHLAGLRFYDRIDPTGVDHEEANGKTYASFVNEGLHLIRANSTSRETIGCLCFSNPFSYALLRDPASGGSPFFDYGTNFTERFLPAAARLVGNADILMYQKGGYRGGRTNILLEHCSALLAQRYDKIAESENWILFKRKA
ncbi:MAG: hypothetical protein WAM39_24710 [Bryobacteraceae bacterium]